MTTHPSIYTTPVDSTCFFLKTTNEKSSYVLWRNRLQKRLEISVKLSRIDRAILFEKKDAILNFWEVFCSLQKVEGTEVRSKKSPFR